MTTFATTQSGKRKDYWDARPCNGRHSPIDVGTREYFDQVKARRYFVEPPIPAFAEFQRWRGCKVLEIGCGIGTDTMNFARAGAKVTAVDLSAKSLELARRDAGGHGFRGSIRVYEAHPELLSDLAPPQGFDAG